MRRYSGMLIFQGRVKVSGSVDRRFVHQVIRCDARVALRDRRLVAGEVARPIQPGHAVQAGHVDDERVAFPTADRLSHPRIRGRLAGIFEEHVSHRAGVLVCDEERALALHDLERVRHVARARHARQIALDLRIALEPFVAVLVPDLQLLGLVRDLAAVDHSHAARHGADSAKGEDLLRRQRSVGAGPRRHRVTRHVPLEVVIGGIHRLPDSVQIGVAVGEPRRPVSLRLTSSLSLNAQRHRDDDRRRNR